jgi:hypothetical protein
MAPATAPKEMVQRLAWLKGGAPSFGSKIWTCALPDFGGAGQREREKQKTGVFLFSTRNSEGYGSGL